MIPEAINVQKELGELRAKIVACQETASLTKGPSREEIIDAVLPTVMERVQAAGRRDLEIQRAAIEQTLKEGNDALLGTVTPRINLTAETLDQLVAWVTNWQKGGGG